MSDRPYWCEICARKKECYGITLKPKCFVPTADRKTEPQKNCDNCGTPKDKCVYCIEEDRMWTPKTEPQTDTHDIRTETHECVKDTHDKVETMSCQECKWWFTDSLKHGGYCQSLLYNHECRYEPEVDCSWK